MKKHAPIKALLTILLLCPITSYAVFPPFCTSVCPIIDPSRLGGDIAKITEYWNKFKEAKNKLQEVKKYTNQIGEKANIVTNAFNVITKTNYTQMLNTFTSKYGQRALVKTIIKKGQPDKDPNSLMDSENPQSYQDYKDAISNYYYIGNGSNDEAAEKSTVTNMMKYKKRRTAAKHEIATNSAAIAYYKLENARKAHDQVDELTKAFENMGSKGSEDETEGDIDKEDDVKDEENPEEEEEDEELRNLVHFRNSVNIALTEAQAEFQFLLATYLEMKATQEIAKHNPGGHTGLALATNPPSKELSSCVKNCYDMLGHLEDMENVLVHAVNVHNARAHAADITHLEQLLTQRINEHKLVYARRMDQEKNIKLVLSKIFHPDYVDHALKVYLTKLIQKDPADPLKADQKLFARKAAEEVFEEMLSMVGQKYIYKEQIGLIPVSQALGHYKIEHMYGRLNANCSRYGTDSPTTCTKGQIKSILKFFHTKNIWPEAIDSHLSDAEKEIYKDLYYYNEVFYPIRTENGSLFPTADTIITLPKIVRRPALPINNHFEYLMRSIIVNKFNRLHFPLYYLFETEFASNDYHDYTKIPDPQNIQQFVLKKRNQLNTASAAWLMYYKNESNLWLARYGSNIELAKNYFYLNPPDHINYSPERYEGVGENEPIWYNEGEPIWWDKPASGIGSDKPYSELIYSVRNNDKLEDCAIYQRLEGLPDKGYEASLIESVADKECLFTYFFTDKRPARNFTEAHIHHDDDLSNDIDDAKLFYPELEKKLLETGASEEQVKNLFHYMIDSYANPIGETDAYQYKRYPNAGHVEMAIINMYFELNAQLDAMIEQQKPFGVIEAESDQCQATDAITDLETVEYCFTNLDKCDCGVNYLIERQQTLNDTAIYLIQQLVLDNATENMTIEQAYAYSGKNISQYKDIIMPAEMSEMIESKKDRTIRKLSNEYRETRTLICSANVNIPEAIKSHEKLVQKAFSEPPLSKTRKMLLEKADQLLVEIHAMEVTLETQYIPHKANLATQLTNLGVDLAEAKLEEPCTITDLSNYKVLDQSLNPFNQ